MKRLIEINSIENINNELNNQNLLRKYMNFSEIITTIACFGTIFALIQTNKSINDSRIEAKKESARRSLEVFFHNLDNSLNNLIFFAHTGVGGPETHFGKNAIFRIIANPFISGITMHPHNYATLNDYIEYVHITSNSIFELTKELENDNLANFYFDKLNREIIFLIEALPLVIEHAICYEEARHKDEKVQFLKGLLYRINDIKGIGLYSRKDTYGKALR